MTAVILRRLAGGDHYGLAHRMTGGELTLGAVLARRGSGNARSPHVTSSGWGHVRRCTGT
ncbi:hypothetical protein [Streptomyces sp. NPDC001652]|uniref:hypothetical protein n=1 Tax=Streptomyces sp. NPDC001652 TaxID=3154393 RepID=UPI00332150FA